MSLYVDQSPGADDPTQDIYTISWNDGNVGQGATVTINGSLGSITSISAATVTYEPAVTSGKATADRLYDLVNTDASAGDNWANPILITALSGGTDPYSGKSIEGNGSTYVDTAVTPNVIHVVYDTSQDGGQGIDAFDTAGNPIQTPNAVILYHELSHAYHYAIDQSPFPQTACPGVTTDEPAAEIDENVMRQELGLCLRNVCNHDTQPGWGDTCGGSATPGGPPLSTGGGSSGGSGGGGGGGSIGCFIVTAATGTDEAVEVVRLREIRDRLAGASTTASSLIDAIYEQYHQFSPAIAENIAGDPTARMLVRRLVIAPLFAWFTLADMLAAGQTDEDRLQAALGAVYEACPPHWAETVIPLLWRLRLGKPLGRGAPTRLLEIAPALDRAAGLPLATWALVDPLIGAWTCGSRRGGLVEAVADWLALAPIEAASPPRGGAATDSEIRRLAAFFAFAPAARRAIGARLVAAWPAASAALRRHGFL